MGGDYKRACDVCGYEEWFSKMRYIGQGRYVCRDDRRGLTAEQIARHNGRVRPLAVRPRRHPRISTEIPTFQHEEALVFGSPLVAGVAANSPYFDVTSGDGALLAAESTLHAEDITTPAALAWMTRYLAAVVVENIRPTAWITQARTRLRTLADALWARQIGFGNTPAATLNNSETYGGFKRYLTDDGMNTDVFVEDSAVGGLAFLAAYQVLGDRKYIDYAKGCAHSLRMFQQSGDHTNSFIPGTYVDGAWSSVCNRSDSNEYDGRFYVSSLICLEFLTALYAVSGDFACGSATTMGGLFGTAPAKALSLCIAGGRAFWESGTYDMVTRTTYTGLSAATPREYFNTAGNKLDGAINGTGAWAYAAGTSITGRGWAQAVASLYAVDAMSTSVASLYAYLRSFSSSPTFETPAGTATRTLYAGLTGTYDTSLALATLLDTATALNGSSYYDWATVGLLAPLQSAVDAAGLLRAKDEMGRARKRFRENTGRDDQRDTALQRGKTGLTFQTSWTSDLLSDGVQRRAHDAEAMAMAAMAYRYAPKAANQLQG